MLIKSVLDGGQGHSSILDLFFVFFSFLACFIFPFFFFFLSVFSLFSVGIFFFFSRFLPLPCVAGFAKLFDLTDVCGILVV